MPRIKKTIPQQKISFYLPEPLATRIQLLLADPLSGRTKHGALSKLFERLARDWLENMESLPPDLFPPSEGGENNT